VHQRNQQPFGIIFTKRRHSELAHYTKNPEALRTKAVRACASLTRHVVFLTGTQRLGQPGTEPP
jgi:hypothetical protein